MSGPDELVVAGPRPLRGRLRPPGDKGISHRAVLASAMADGSSTIAHLATGDDVTRTVRALGALGLSVVVERGVASVRGRGVEALTAPTHEIDCGNSGTTMRMLIGLLSARPFTSVLVGDPSLSRRPMQRVVEPLRALGARVEARGAGGCAPIQVRGGPLTGARVELPVASGQVKTALLLAGLQATGTSVVVEPAPSRDHTERLLGALGAPIEVVDARTTRVRAGAPRSFDAVVPGDPSSGAFFVVAATVTPGSELVLEDVALNPGRIAFVGVLREMGANITVIERGERLGEPVGDLRVTAAHLTGTTFECTEATIDEVPALAVAAAFAEGVTEIHNAAELRVKESDRIATMGQELIQLGVGVEPAGDGFRVRGGTPRAATFKSHGDHRVAMAMAVAANAATGESRVRGWSSAAISYPDFDRDLHRLTGRG